MSTSFRRTKFREFLTPKLRPHTLGATEDADLVGMRLYGAGPFHRELKPAMQIAKKSHFVIRAGDVIYNKLFAWKGTFGIVHVELDGMFVSDKFPTYELDRNKVDENYLRWFFRHPDVWEQARLMSTGSAALSKLTLNPPKFLELTIPVPSSVEQQRKIAAWIEALSENVKAAQAIRRDAKAEVEALILSSASAILEEVPATGTLIDVLLAPPRNGWSPKCDNNPNGVAVLTLSAITGWHYNSDAFKRTSLPTNPAAQQLAAAVAPLVGKVPLERLRLLDVERLEVLIPAIGFEPGNRLRHRVNGLLAVALSLGKIGEVLTLYPLVCGVVTRHRLSLSEESQFTLG